MSFYTSGAAAGDEVEVILYEDPTGLASGPEPALEVWRTAASLGSGGFQEVSATGSPTLNPDGSGDGIFFAAVKNKAGRSYTLGIDMDGPYAGATYVSSDDGRSFAPTSTMPIFDGNAMIRAHAKAPESCFIGTAIR